MNESILVPLLKNYIGAESKEDIENVMEQLSEITGFEDELIFDEIHCRFPHLHNNLVHQLQQDGDLPNIQIKFHLF